MPDFLEKVRFIKSYSGTGESGVPLVLFSKFQDYERWITGLLNLSKIPNVMFRKVNLPADLLGVKAERCFLWNDIESYHAVIQKDIKLRLGASFIYDLEREEYIFDFAAEKV